MDDWQDGLESLDEIGAGKAKPGRRNKPLRRFGGPNIVILTSAESPPVPGAGKPRTKPPPEKAETAQDGSASGAVGTKSEIRGMSKKSSLNLSRLLSMLDWAKNGQCIHVTLTYGRRQWPRTKADLTSTKAELVRDIGRQGVCGIWRLEYQSRETQEERATRLAKGLKRERGQGGSIKVPHFHLLVWCRDQPVEKVAAWFEQWWGRFSGNHSPRGCHITTGDQVRGTWYLAMHAAKLEQAPPFAVGRWWGYVDRDALLGASDLHAQNELTKRERIWWQRLFRRGTRSKVRDNTGFTWFLPRVWQCEVNAWVMAFIAWEKAGKPFPKY